jgi:hypothetical protein
LHEAGFAASAARDGLGRVNGGRQNQGANALPGRGVAGAIGQPLGKGDLNPRLP